MMTLIKGYMVPFWQIMYNITLDKVEKILKGSLDSIPSSSPSVKIQFIGRCKGKTLLVFVNKLFISVQLIVFLDHVLLLAELAQKLKLHTSKWLYDEVIP